MVRDILPLAPLLLLLLLLSNHFPHTQRTTSLFRLKHKQARLGHNSHLSGRRGYDTRPGAAEGDGADAAQPSPGRFWWAAGCRQSTLPGPRRRGCCQVNSLAGRGCPCGLRRFPQRDQLKRLPFLLCHQLCRTPLPGPSAQACSGDVLSESDLPVVCTPDNGSAGHADM